MGFSKWVCITLPPLSAESLAVLARYKIPVMTFYSVSITTLSMGHNDDTFWDYFDDYLFEYCGIRYGSRNYMSSMNALYAIHMSITQRTENTLWRAWIRQYPMTSWRDLTETTAWIHIGEEIL